VNLVLTHYCQSLNSLPALTSTNSIDEAIQAAYSDPTLSQVFDSLLPLLSSQEESIQKMTVSALMVI
jgi:hypothetical protein